MNALALLLALALSATAAEPGKEAVVKRVVGPCQGGNKPSDALKAALREHVAKEIGAFAKPDDIRFTGALPKTRSGKIMRRLLRDIAAGKESIGDTTTIEDLAVLAKLRESDE